MVNIVFQLEALDICSNLSVSLADKLDLLLHISE